jgi:pimeloyl-ACP methyl ester carboxylesterase
MRALAAEVLKLKRTLALRMVLLAPALVALLSLLAQSAAILTGRSDLTATLWHSHSQTSLTMWAIFLLPLLITIETALLAGIEHDEKQWKHTFALPVPRTSVYFAKFAVAQALAALSTLVLCAFIVVTGWLLILWHPSLAAAGAPPVASIVGRALGCWLAAGPILSINLWIALRWPSFTVPLGAGIAGTFFALFASSAKVAAYYPWLLPLDFLAADERAKTALILGIAGGIVVAILGCIDFNRREESAPPQLGRGAALALAAVVLAFLGLAGYLDRETLWGHHAPFTTRFVTVDRGVKLEVLDWGGPAINGRPVVLLAGLGNTAHAFEKFAPKLTRDYHVYGITRRGFGASSHPASGYSADRLGDDVLAVINALKIERPVLAGHSLGGEELSSIGTRHPEKVAGLVYLDAAYSYAYYDPARGDFNIDLWALDGKLDKLKPGSGLRDPRPIMSDVADSLPAFERVLRQQIADFGVLAGRGRPGQPPPESPDQRIRSEVGAARAIAAGEQKFAAIHVPILAIYALPHDVGATNPNRAAAEARDIADLTGPQANAFQAANPTARVVRLPRASHYVYESNEADVLREMRAFIAAAP